MPCIIFLRGPEAKIYNNTDAIPAMMTKSIKKSYRFFISMPKKLGN
jgi:hypothetical protein